MAENIKVYSFIGKKRNAYDLAEYISGQQFAAQLEQAAAGDSPEINVSVHSGGGSIVDGFLMVSAMKKSPKPVNCIIDGYAASMGYFICLGATGKVTAAKNSIIMTHAAQGSVQGTADEMREEAEVLDKFNAIIIEILCARTGLSAEDAKAKFLSGDTYFTAQEALDAKLIDAIEEYSAENVPAVTASMSYEEATKVYAAMLNDTREAGLIEKIVAKVRESFTTANKNVKAELTEAEENWLCELLWSVRSAADTADIAAEYAAAEPVKALLDKVMKANSVFVVEITNAVYGEETTEPMEPGARAKALFNKVAEKHAAQKAEAITAQVTAEVQKQFAETIVAKDTAIANASKQIEELQAQIAQLSIEPGIKGTRAQVPAGDKAAVEPKKVTAENVDEFFFPKTA